MHINFDSQISGAAGMKSTLGEIYFFGNRKLSLSGKSGENRVFYVGKRDGKIKDRAHLGLSHCLHIVFPGPPQNWRAHPIGAMPHGSRENGVPTLNFPSYSVVFE